MPVRETPERIALMVEPNMGDEGYEEFDMSRERDEDNRRPATSKTRICPGRIPIMVLLLSFLLTLALFVVSVPAASKLWKERPEYSLGIALRKIWGGKPADSIVPDSVSLGLQHPYYDLESLPSELYRGIYRVVYTQRPRTLRYVCRDLCGGLADRVRGVQTLLQLAAATGRQLVVDGSLFTKSPLPREPSLDQLYPKVYYFRVTQNCSNILNIVSDDTMAHIELETNCWIVPYRWEIKEKALHQDNITSYDLPKDAIRLANLAALRNTYGLANDADIAAADALAVHCQMYHDCGMAAVAIARVAERELARVVALATALRAGIGGPYVAIHVRCGGSRYTSGGLRANATVSAVDYKDGYDGPMPQAVLNYLRELRASYVTSETFLGDVVLVSDSMRYKGEVSTVMAGSAPNLIGCCYPAKHIDRDKTFHIFPKQEILDLLMLSHAAIILSTAGGYASLARVLTSFPPAITPTYPLSTDPNATRTELNQVSKRLLHAALAGLPIDIVSMTTDAYADVAARSLSTAQS